jgi:hypothetical protein
VAEAVTDEVDGRAREGLGGAGPYVEGAGDVGHHSRPGQSEGEERPTSAVHWPSSGAGTGDSAVVVVVVLLDVVVLVDEDEVVDDSVLVGDWAPAACFGLNSSLWIRTRSTVARLGSFTAGASGSRLEMSEP